MKKKTTSIVSILSILAIFAVLLIGTPRVDWVGNAQTVTIPNRNIYALTSDNSIYVLQPGATEYVRVGRVTGIRGDALLGIDFRPADQTPNILYGLTDTGSIYRINVSFANFGVVELVSTTNPRFAGGFQSLMDFNPVANALRIVGSNDQNFAVVNSADGTNLGTTAVQTSLVYTAGDVNQGINPEIAGGAYSNNFVGAAITRFFMIDHNLDTFVTIADEVATGSSNTGGGQLQTIGQIVNANGAPLNLTPDTDFDIFTNNAGVNFLVGQTSRQLFTIDLSQVNPDLPLGTTQNVVAAIVNSVPRPFVDAPITGSLFDIAIPPRL
jgi:Domain of unknown function (DUF4394)